MLQEHFIELGLKAATKWFVDAAKQQELRTRLKTFLERKFGENYDCSPEEEIDFTGLIEYIDSHFLEDIEKRLFGTREERENAHKSIVGKACAYAQAHTALSSKKVAKVITDAMDILRDFYKQRANKDLLLMAAEIEDVVLAGTSKEHAAIMERFDALEESVLSTRDVVSVDKGLELVGQGQIATVEEKLSQFNACISSRHILSPHYGFQLNTVNGKVQYKSVPISTEAVKMYPPTVKCQGTVRIGTGYLRELTAEAVEYANRHQLPIIIDIKRAEKYLGDILDPVQHEAEELVGEEITISPKPFPSAFPCSISFNDELVFPYLLIRTKEMLDDGTIVLSNYEQVEYPYQITINMHPQNETISFLFQKRDSINNEGSLRYAIVMKKAIHGTKVTVKLLESDTVFAEGMLNSFDYDGGFSSVDEEIDFLSRLVDVEKHFKKTICVPDEIYQKDWDAIIYISDLLRGETCCDDWERYEFAFTLSEGLKEAIAKTEDKEYSFTVDCTIQVPLWGEIYEIPIIRIFEAGKFENLESLKRKVQVLDCGDIVKAIFVKSKKPGKLCDTMRSEES